MCRGDGKAFAGSHASIIVPAMRTASLLPYQCPAGWPLRAGGNQTISFTWVASKARAPRSHQAASAAFHIVLKIQPDAHGPWTSKRRDGAPARNASATRVTSHVSINGMSASAINQPAAGDWETPKPDSHPCLDLRPRIPTPLHRMLAVDGLTPRHQHEPQLPHDQRLPPMLQQAVAATLRPSLNGANNLSAPKRRPAPAASSRPTIKPPGSGIGCWESEIVQSAPPVPRHYGRAVMSAITAKSNLRRSAAAHGKPPDRANGPVQARSDQKLEPLAAAFAAGTRPNGTHVERLGLQRVDQGQIVQFGIVRRCDHDGAPIRLEKLHHTSGISDRTVTWGKLQLARYSSCVARSGIT